MRIDKNRATGTGFKMYYELSGDKLIRKIREAETKVNVPDKPTASPVPEVKKRRRTSHIAHIVVLPMVASTVTENAQLKLDESNKPMFVKTVPMMTSII